MNNDTNNNLNGTVLGNVGDNTNFNNVPNNNPISNETVETLDGGLGTAGTVMNGSQVMDNTPQPTSNTFFNTPPVNDMTASNQGVVNEIPQTQPSSVIEPTPSVEPTPAYTNPQSINPAPMPGFENSGTIGTTPPISLEPEKKTKKKTNKTLFVIIILVVLAGVGFGTYYVLNYTDLLNNQEVVTVNAKDVQINMGDALSANINDYAEITGTDVKNCSLNTSSVNASKEGIYEFQVTCGEIVKTGNVTVVDNTELVVDTQKVYKVKGSALEAKEFALNPDETLTYEFVDQTDVDTKLNGEYGTYTVRIKATAQSGKTVEVDAELVIIQYEIKGYSICTSKEQNVTGTSAIMTVSEKFAIVNDDNNGYGNIAYEIHTFKFSDETEYTTHLATYKTNNEITINNITGDASFDDETLTIKITNEKDNETAISEYGENNLVNYSSIRNYFQNTLGYTCTYDKIQ